MDSVCIDITNCTTICCCLEKIIKKSTGPNAFQNMISTATGNVLLSSCGQTILESLHLSHPVGRMIINSVSGHHSYTGNNSKTFILILSELLRQVHHYIERSSTHGQWHDCSAQNFSRQDLIQLSRAFQTIHHEVLPKEVTSQLMQISTTTKLKEDNYQSVKEMCFAIIKTSMVGKFNQLVVEILSCHLCDFIFTNCRSIDRLHSEVMWLIDHFDNLSTQMIDLTSESKIIEGILVQGDFVIQALDTDQQCRTKCKFILVDCEFSAKPETNSVLSFERDDELQRAFEYQSKIIKIFLQQCNMYEVNLLISTHKMSDMILFLFKEFAISVVQMVSEDIVSFLSTVCRIQVIHSLWEPLIDNHISTANFCKTFSQKSYRHVVLGITDDSDHKVHQMIICAPVQSICRQYQFAVFNSLKCVRTWLETRVLLSYMAEKPPSLQMGLSNEQMSSCDLGVSVPGGGTTEFHVYRILQKRKERECDQYLKTACDILSKALLYVVKVLYENSSSVKCQEKSYPELLQQMTEKVDAGDFSWGISDKDGCLQDMYSMCIFESLPGKYLVLNDVISLLLQILRLEMMVSVTSQKNSQLKMTDSDSDKN